MAAAPDEERSADPRSGGVNVEALRTSFLYNEDLAPVAT
jgi:hypothetical protein